jgi:hypothetical protein
VRAVALSQVTTLKAWLTAQPRSAHNAFALSQIAAFEKDPDRMKLPKPQDPPPGMPIGQFSGDLGCDWR